MKQIPQLIPNQGSQKNIAERILALVSDNIINTLAEPFPDDDITAQLNEIYAEEESTLDRGIMALQIASIGDEQW